MSKIPFPQWEPGQALEQARLAAGLNKSEAARLAGLSESRWRQLESGARKQQGQWLPATAPALTLIRAANAVGLDPKTVLKLAGKDDDSDLHQHRERITHLLEKLDSQKLYQAESYVHGLLSQT